MASRKLLAGCAVVALAGGGAYVLAPDHAASVTPSKPATMAAYDRPTPTAAPVFHPYWEHGRAPRLAAPAVASPQPAVASESRVTAASAPGGFSERDNRRVTTAAAAAPVAPVAPVGQDARDAGGHPSGWPHFDAEDAAQSVLGARHAASRAGQPLAPSAHAPLVPGAQQVRMHLLSTRTR